MNSKNVELVKNESYPFLPVLTGLKTTRVVTKHFTNLSLYMNPNMYALLTWLIYQSRNDNTIEYNVHLLEKYRRSVIAARDQYGPNGLKIGLLSIRESFKWLIENGYLFLTYDRFVYMINPLLTYRSEYIRSPEYKDVCERYQHVQFGTGIDVRDLTKEYRDLINKRIKEKKK